MASTMPTTVRGTDVPVNANGTVDINALIQGTADRVTGHWYYTLKLAAGAVLQPQYNLFNAALNDPDPYPLATIVGPPFPILTKVETNIPSRCNNGLPPPYDTVVDSIGCFVQQNTLKADMDMFLQYGYFEFAILSKIQWEGKMESYPAGMGISGFTSQTNESGWQVGLPDPNAKKRFGRYGKYLAPNLMWSFNLYFPPQSGPVIAPAVQPAAPSLLAAGATPTPGVGLVFRAYVFGLIDRPVL